MVMSQLSASYTVSASQMLLAELCPQIPMLKPSPPGSQSMTAFGDTVLKEV